MIEIPIAWGEMDSFQHVNNAAYFRYFESARILYSEKLGLHKHKDETGIGPGRNGAGKERGRVLKYRFFICLQINLVCYILLVTLQIKT